MFDLETRRKIFHLLNGLLLVLAVRAGIADAAVLLLCAAAVALLGLLSLRARVPLFSGMLEGLERAENLATFPAKGTVFFFLGAALALLLFPRPAAFAGILVLATGDAVSCVVGRRFGRIRHPFNARKMVEGHLAGALAAGAVCLAVVPPLPAFACAAAAMFVEGFDLRVGRWTLDDNLSLPLLAAAVADLLGR